MSKISFNTCKSITFWQEWEEGSGMGEPAIVIGKDSSNTYYLSQEGKDISISEWEIQNFIKELSKFVKTK